MSLLTRFVYFLREEQRTYFRLSIYPECSLPNYAQSAVFDWRKCVNDCLQALLLLYAALTAAIGVS